MMCVSLHRYTPLHSHIFQSAQELSAATLGQDLATALQKVAQWIEDDTGKINKPHRSKAEGEEYEADDDELDLKNTAKSRRKETCQAKDSTKLKVFGERLKSALRDVWKERGTDLFDVGFVH